ncbi:hypothetical protein [Niallia oryzisoli]|uniref:hypothetical protein n=1 Tax=Niallia oryzisoli TaxID=1737571 RepID=UPI0037365E22
MNKVITDYHNKRYEWAFHAKKEFLDKFIQLDVKKMNLLHIAEDNSIGSDMNISPFLCLTNCLNLAEKERKQKAEETNKELERLGHIISEKKAVLDQKLNFFHMKNHEYLSKIEKYTRFSNEIEAIIQEIEHTNRELLVKNILTYDVKQKKASVLNQHALQLQHSFEKKIDNQLSAIKERAEKINLSKASHLKLPNLDPIPKIQQKIDSYWLTSRYDKAFNRMCHNAILWVEQLYHAYKEVLTPILDEVLMHRDQLLIEAEALKCKKELIISEWLTELADKEKTRDALREEHVKVNEMWAQDCEHAKQLQGYFIKHWLRYKEELQEKFLTTNPQERWAATQYLQLLQQDGENIIESMNI